MDKMERIKDETSNIYKRETASGVKGVQSDW